MIHPNGTDPLNLRPPGLFYPYSRSPESYFDLGPARRDDLQVVQETPSLLLLLLPEVRFKGRTECSLLSSRGSREPAEMTSPLTPDLLKGFECEVESQLVSSCDQKVGGRFSIRDTVILFLLRGRSFGAQVPYTCYHNLVFAGLGGWLFRVPKLRLMRKRALSATKTTLGFGSRDQAREDECPSLT